MKVEIIAKNYKLSDHLREVVESKLEKFSRYFDENSIAKVLLKQVNDDKYAMEITINFGGGKIMRSEVISDNMYNNIDIALPKLERQVRKHRTKLDKQIKESGFEGAMIYDDKLPPTETEQLKLARTKVTEVRKMDVKDAIEEMELLDHDFYVFINNANDSVNVVYRRAVGDVGLLDLIY